MPKSTAKRILIAGSGSIAALLTCLFFAANGPARPSVEVLAPQPSSQRPKITVMHDGGPVRHAEVAVSITSTGKAVVKLSTDDRGTVVLPSLHGGQYTVFARASGRLQAYLVLDISKRPRQSEFSLQLQPGPPSLEEMVTEAESAAPPEHIAVLGGTVVDPSGAGVPGVEIRVYKRGSIVKPPISSLKTDSTGHFAASLPSGAYTATFAEPGFRIKILVFQIEPDSPSREIRVRLDLEAVT